MLQIKKRPVTFQDFVKLKGYAPFKKWRQTGKTVNFSTIFNVAPPKLGVALENNGFSFEDCKNYIKLGNFGEDFIKFRSTSKFSDKESYFVFVASKIIESFFEGYKGLKTRLDREQQYAIKNGFVRGWHGTFRQLPELLFMTVDSKGWLKGADKVLYSKLLTSLKNIAGNSNIQTMEVRVAFATWYWIMYWLEKWDFKSWIWNGIHDSIDLYVYEPEEEVVKSLVFKVSSKIREPYYDIPMLMDGEIVDLDIEGEYYTHGKEIEYDLELEKHLEEYNQLHGTNLKFDEKIIY